MRLLVIEDDPALQRTLAAALREEGYAVDVASDGADGLFKAQQNTYDAILLDVMLPKLDGWGVLAALRPACRTPVLMLTARDAVPDRIKGLNAGADDYLTKPFDIDELLARLRALIRRSAGQTHPTLTIGELVLDTAARRACVAGAEIVLTAREYSLLEYLALHRGEVVSRTTLYEHLFDEDDDSLSNLLDVHVSNLRKKLGHDLIVTRRGLGYCIA
ncbi:MAG TPA: response regulator transcription factor [Opitutaceae bacterium]|jgi:two-component system, OmpR family, response regulator|nr:response regulator transcription factor [Opitutaceae bacterium]HNW41093.1 response regulator transcription factor [Opitutaceae bacterium]HOD47865.1 response regulator transcription factor [Opitutaceae bacterium]HOF08863.1 response regulator transcription factor [Opitutaceae bacterium]HOG92350.1 response regulator transcription factor [Opitutaceae bacterium]